ncbi:MAG: methylenetetrahydrofolate reductase [Planctomycetota bacterium]|jgi:methylenetetrahydrofolate reductase (NADPH)
MRITDLLKTNKVTFSLEFFPPKTEEGERTLFEETIPKLKRLNPTFSSVTYGAGGSTRSQTLRIVNRIKKEFSIEAMPHLTCVGSTREMIGEVLEEARGMGVENILALRGDPPKGETEFKATEGGFTHSLNLIEYIREKKHFAIGASGYPEGHIECTDKVLDWDRTAAKVKAGAQFLITQLFYDVDAFLSFQDYLRTKHKVDVPIIPGVLPFLGAEQVKRFTGLCGAKIPTAILQKIDACKTDEEVRSVGVEVCTDICSRLIKHGTKSIHIYSLNRVPSSEQLVRNLGLI